MKLTGKQIKAANRVGGIELMIPWPEDCLPLPVGLAEDDERPANAAEAQYIIQQFPHDYLIQHDLVLVRRAVTVVERPTLPPHPNTVRPHLVAIIIGRRWVGARSGDTRPKTMWATVG